MKILIHAMMYPESARERRANTSLFLHEYAQRWVRSGHDVLVLHHKMAYPAWMEKLSRAVARAVPPLCLSQGIFKWLWERRGRAS